MEQIGQGTSILITLILHWTHYSQLLFSKFNWTTQFAFSHALLQISYFKRLTREHKSHDYLSFGCFLYCLVNLLKYEICDRIWLKANQVVQFNFDNSSQLYCVQCSINVFNMLSLGHFLILRTSCCCQSVHELTSRYDSTLLGHTFLQ